jgi:PAS domain S-box-containing protein
MSKPSQTKRPRRPLPPAAAAPLLQRALQESEERLRCVLANSVDVIYRRNLQADLYDCVSPSVETITGYTPAEFMRGGLQSTIERIHPDDLESAMLAIDRVMGSPDGRGRALYRYRRKDGVYRWFADHYTVTRDGRGAPLYWVGTVRDVTDLKEAEGSLLRSRDSLEAVVRERTAQLHAMTAELIGVEEAERARIGHVLHEDLQQILAGLRFALLAPRHNPPGSTTASLVELVDQALQVARELSAELLPPTVAEGNLADVLEWLASDMQARFGLQVGLTVAEGAEFDDEAMRTFAIRAVRELLLNVVKHAGAGHASLDVAMLADSRLRLTLADQGAGFDASGAVPGGLGLFRIRERAAFLGGELQVTAARGKGTTVALTLPRR